MLLADESGSSSNEEENDEIDGILDGEDSQGERLA